MESITILEPIVFEEQVMRRTANGDVSVFDLIGVVGGQSSPRKVWERIAGRHPEVVTECHYFKFMGRGQKETPVIGKLGAMKLLGLLPGEAGSRYRQEAAELLLAWYEAPEELAKSAIAKIEDKDKLADVLAAAQEKYLSKYHPLLDTVADRVKDGYAIQGVAVVETKLRQACVNVNTLNTKTVLGDIPKAIVATRGGKNARSKLNPEEYSQYSVLQDAQLVALQRRPDVAKVSEVNAVCKETAEKFTEFWRSL
jgi:hypothetical protein